MTGMRWAGAAVLLLALAGCGGDDQSEPPPAEATVEAEPVDYVAWEAALEKQIGRPVADFATVKDIYANVCDKSEDDFGMWAALAIDGGTESEMRLSISYACPERGDEIDAVVLNAANIDRICREGAVTEEEQQLAEAMRC